MGQEKKMIEPFEAKQVKVVDGRPVISYGVSSYGYDIRVGRHFKIQILPSSPAASGRGLMGSPPVAAGNDVGEIDPKNFDSTRFRDFEGDVCVIPPHGM